jgi:hypothetical protein
VSGIARADDQPFLTLDATDIEPELGHELEQNFTWASGLYHQSFNSLEGETELEYGLSDQIQLAGSAEYEWSRARPHAPGGPAESDKEFEGVAGEAIWQAMNVYFDPMGLGFLVSPFLGRDERGVEAKALLQKNFINDRLRAVINAGLSFGQARDGHDWSDESTITLDAGLAYNITWEWSLAAEFNYERGFDGAMIDGRAIPQGDTFYFGPTLQYVAHPWTASLGVQEQLPWAHDLTHTPETLHEGLNTDSERFRVMLRVTRDFF